MAMDMVEVYWKYLGLPFSRWAGAMVDRTPWSVSNILLCWGLLCACLLPLAWRHAWPWSVRYTLVCGIIVVGIQMFSQGATPFDFVPTVFRAHPSHRVNAVEVQPELFEKWFTKTQQKILSISEQTYRQALSEPNLGEVHEALTQVLKDLHYPEGRVVLKIKTMQGLTRLLGLAYGGPAYHDVVTGEVVLASPEDYPSTKVWRWCAVVHEVAHAQGFTREIDAEILTWLALKKLGDMGVFCSHALALSKTQRELKWPEFYQAELRLVQEQRQALNQPVVAFLKKMLQGVRVQNRGDKYGALAEKDNVPPADHEFFKVVLAQVE